MPRFDPEAFRKEIGLTEDTAAADIPSNEVEEEKKKPRLSDSQTPRQAAANTEKQELKRGVSTEVGEAVNSLWDLPANWANDRARELNEATPDDSPFKGITNFMDETVFRSADEQLKEARQIPVLGDVLVGGGEGIRAGLNMPATVAARLEGAAAPWSDPPEVIKGSVVGETTFKIMEILAPTLVIGAGTGGRVSPQAVLVGESLLETATQRSADDLIAGRELAIQLGNLANAAGYDGSQLTKDLLEGKKPSAQVLVALAGFGQNLGLNWGANKLLGEVQKRLFPGKPGIFEVPEGTELFHGTSEKAAGLIQKGGFKDGPGIFGRGVYLAEDDLYASQYAQSAAMADDLSDEAFEALDLAKAADGDLPPGRLIYGYLPGGVKILDVAGSGLSTRKFARRLGNKKPGEVVKFIREWAKANDFDGVRFVAAESWDKKDGIVETLIFDPKVADRITSNATPTGPSSPYPGSPEDIARQTGKSVEDVRKSLDDRQQIRYTYDQEIHEAARTVDELVEANRPSKGNDFVNDEALQQKMLGEDRIEYDDTYFSNLEALTSEDSVAVAIARATDGLQRMPRFSEDTAFALSKASRFLDATLDQLDDNFDEVVDKFFDEMTDPLPRGINVKTGGFDQASDTQMVMDVGSKVARADGMMDMGLREYRITNVEGMAAGAALVEEVGRRLSKQAQVVSNLETGSVEFSKAVDDFFKLEDKLNLFAIPLRRAKRQWAITGTMQQREMIEALKDADVFKAGVSKRRKGSFTQDGYELTKIYKTDVDMDGYTSRELWEKFKKGDKDAGDTLKLYIHTVAYGNSRTMLTEVDNLNKVLKEQLRKGNAAAGKNLMYQYWLSRLAPQAASIGSNVFNGAVMPIGTALMGERAFSRGMIVGTFTSINEAFQNAATAWKRGQGMFGSSKFDNDAKALAVRRADEEKLWLGTQKIMNREGATGAQKAAAYLNHVRRKFAMMPGMDFAMRGLSAGDDFFSTIISSQLATGRAYKLAADTDNWKDLDRLIKQEFKNVFRDGVATGKIIDPEVIEASRYITFQRDIPTGPDANRIDDTFTWLQNASANNPFFNYLSPFTRLTYNTLEVGGTFLAGSLDTVGTIPRAFSKDKTKYKPGTWLLSRVSRIEKTLAGEFGETAQMQLQANLAFAEHWAVLVGGLSTLGFVTGNNPPEGLPKKSFIIPAPGTKTGWVGVSYARIEPIATPTSLIADLTTAFRDRAITQKQYGKLMTDGLAALGASTLDKSFLGSMSDTAGMFDLKNFSETTVSRNVSRLAGLATSQVTGAVGGLTRMIADWTQPYETINKERDSFFGTLDGQLKAMLLGGQGNPPFTNPYTGEKETKTADVGYFNGIMGALDEAAPIDFKNSQNPNHPIFREFREVGYERNIDASLKTYKGVSLSKQEQARMLELMYPSLPDSLKELFKRDQYKQLKRLANSGDENARQALYGLLDAKHTQAKEEAMQKMLQDDALSPALKTKLLRKEATSSSTPSSAMEEVLMMYR